MSDFPNIFEAEKVAVAAAEARRDTLKNAIAMADGLLGMAATQHYKQFLAALEDILRARTLEAVSAKTDREAAVASGRALELREVLLMATQTENRRTRLVALLEQEEDRLQKLTHPETAEFLS